jgi:putative transcriptional regulator
MKTLGRQNSYVISGHFSTKGHLLVAAPSLTDPNFHHSVVFMLEHRTDGAVGVVINRPLVGGTLRGLDDWQIHLKEPATAYIGGPVEVDGLIGLASMRGPVMAEFTDESDLDLADSPSSGDPTPTRIPADEWVLGTIDLSQTPDRVAVEIGAVRIFRGYAGWGPLQLDAELAADSWIVVGAEPGDVFSSDPAGLWRDVLRRQGGRVAWLANAPDDLSAN